MDELTLTIPALLFPAISLLLLAYTNRFLSYAQVVRNLKEKLTSEDKEITKAQIINLRKRLILTRNMQILGICSLLFCVISMLFIYISWREIAIYIFGTALFLLIISLAVCIWEIVISARALEIYLDGAKEKNDSFKKQ
jgi:hypothetical protein